MKRGSWGSVSLTILLLVSLIVPTFVSSTFNPIGTVNATAPNNISSAVAIDPPTYVYLTLTTSDPAHSIKVNWRSDENYVGQVKYGTKSGSYDKTADGTGGITADNLDGYIHHVDLTGLSPDTVYYFICGNPENGWSEELSFKTAPVDSKDIRFVVGGDSRWDPRYPYPDWPASRDDITKLMASYNPDFALFVGDYIWSGEYQQDDILPYGYTRENFPDTWDNWLEAWYKFARTDSGRLIAFIPVIGNHEVIYPEPSLYDPKTEASNYCTLFDMPVEENRYAWYSLNWGPELHIAIFDSEILDSHSNVYNAQIGWLEQDLNQHLSLWNIAADHKPIQDFDSDPWTKEFDIYHMDLVFSGHEHYYERSHPINLLNHQNLHSSASFTTPENGTIYVVSGGWGAPLNGGTNWYSEVGPIVEYSFGLVDIHRNGTLQFKAINTDNHIIDNFAISKSAQPPSKGVALSILPIAVVIVVIVCFIIIFLYLRR